jgi:acetate kinase
MFCYRIKKYIGAYLAVLGRADAIVFTGGIGENASAIRERVCEGLEPLGVAVDRAKNGAPLGNVAEIQKNGAPVRVLVIRTNEELEIARQTIHAVQASGDMMKQVGQGFEDLS